MKICLKNRHSQQNSFKKYGAKCRAIFILTAQIAGFPIHKADIFTDWNDYAYTNWRVEVGSYFVEDDQRNQDAHFNGVSILHHQTVDGRRILKVSTDDGIQRTNNCFGLTFQKIRIEIVNSLHSKNLLCVTENRNTTNFNIDN